MRGSPALRTGRRTAGKPARRGPAGQARPTAPASAALEVAAALLFRRGKLLLTRRRQEDHLGGLWEFPGGKREPGETSAECLRRELREELGIDADVLEVVARITHDYPDRRVRIEFFRAQLRRGEPRPLGCQSVAWVTPEQLASYEFPAADARLLLKLRTSPELWRQPPGCSAGSREKPRRS